MSQEKIQAWIERIIAHIRDVIRLEGKLRQRMTIHWFFGRDFRVMIRVPTGLFSGPIEFCNDSTVVA